MGGQRGGKAAAALLVGLALLVVAVVLLQDLLSQLWGWLGWWHWVVLPLLGALAALGAVALLRVAPREEPRAPDPHRTALDDAVAEEQERLEALPLHQLVLEVSRTLRRDGWADARVEGGVLVVAHRGAQSLVVRCKDLPSGRVTREEVEALVARASLSASGVAVFATSGGYGRAGLLAAQELGAVPMDGEDLARWVALGPSAWPPLRPVAQRPAVGPR